MFLVLATFDGTVSRLILLIITYEICFQNSVLKSIGILFIFYYVILNPKFYFNVFHLLDNTFFKKTTSLKNKNKKAVVFWAKPWLPFKL